MESFPVIEPDKKPENQTEVSIEAVPPLPPTVENVGNESATWSERVDEIVNAEIEKRRPEMIQLASRGLGDLFELLPKDHDATKEDIISLLEHTELRIMLPGMRDEFAKEVIKKNIQNIEDEAQFIAESLETGAMKMFIQAEAQKISIDDSLKSIREARENTQQE